jgi:cytochrome c556
MKRFVGRGPAALFGLAVVGVLGIAGAMAADSAPTPEDQAKAAVDIRESIFKLQGWNMDPMAAMLRRRIPFDAKIIERNADRLVALSQMIPDAFKPDTRKFNVETEALPLIWDNMDDFTKKAGDLTAAAKALAMTAASGDQGMTIRAVADVGKACGACHDKFRKQE